MFVVQIVLHTHLHLGHRTMFLPHRPRKPRQSWMKSRRSIRLLKLGHFRRTCEYTSFELAADVNFWTKAVAQWTSALKYCKGLLTFSRKAIKPISKFTFLYTALRSSAIGTSKQRPLKVSTQSSTLMVRFFSILLHHCLSDLIFL